MTRAAPRALAAALLAACADDTRAAAGARDTAAASGAPAAEARRLAVAHDGAVLGLVALGPDRAASAGADRTVRVWSLATGEEAARLGGAAVAVSLAASTGGLSVLAQERNDVVLWRVSDRAPVRRLAGAGELALVAMGPDGRLAAAVGAGEPVRVWRLADGAALVRVAPHASRYLALALAGDSAAPLLLSAAVDERLCVTPLPPAPSSAPAPSAPTPRCSDAPSDGASVAAFSGDGRWAATGNDAGEVRVWDVAAGRLVATYAAHAGQVTALAFTPDGSRLVSGGADATTALADVASGRRLAAVRAPDGYVSALAVTPDGAQALLGTDAGTVLVWRIR